MTINGITKTKKREGGWEQNVCFDQLSSPIKWVVYVVGLGIILSNPIGTRKLIRLVLDCLSEKYKIKKQKFDIRQLSQAIYYAKKKGLIEMKNKNGKTLLILTEKGKKKKLEYNFDAICITKPKKWDGKWRIVMFDVPESNKHSREKFRNKLKVMGFLRFQKSVWINPYVCENEIDFVSNYLNISPYTNVITATIDDDEPLRKSFGL